MKIILDITIRDKQTGKKIIGKEEREIRDIFLNDPNNIEKLEEKATQMVYTSMNKYKADNEMVKKQIESEKF